MIDYMVYLTPSEDKKHKYIMIIETRGLYTYKLLKFGAYGYLDYILSFGDDERKTAYINRHRKREDWTINGVLTKAFWARWVLWNKPTLIDSIKDIEKRFPQIKIKFIP